MSSYEGITHFEIDGLRCPSWQQFYAGQHWSKRSAEKNRIRQEVRAVVDVNLSPYTVPVFIVYIAHYKHHPVDSDNMLTKMLTDALKGWVVVDDDLNYIVGTAPIPRLSDRDAIEIIIIPTQ